MKKAFVLLLVIVLSFNAKSQNDTVIVSGDFNYPPFSFIDKNGKAAGYDIDVMNAIAEITGLNLKFELANWDTTLMKLEAGQVDIVTSIVYSAEREKIYDFSFPLHTEYYAVFAKDTTKINDVNELGNLKPAVLPGDISNELFFKPMGLFQNNVTVSSFPEAFSILQKGSCDYIVAPYSLGMQIIKEYNHKDIDVKGPPIIPSVFCYGVKQGDYELLAWINQGIEILSRNGELDKIYNKWVKYKRDDGQYKKFFYYSLIGLAIFAGAIIILFLFSYSLKRQVRKKTVSLREAIKMADSANKTKSRFLSTISHEIRTPLFAILGYTRLMGKTKLAEEQSEYNKKIEISGKLLLNLVNDILDLTKMEAEKLKLNLKPFDIRKLVKEICELESIKASEKGIELAYEVNENVPDFFVGDKLLLSRVLLNVVNNAIKFTDEGKVSFKVNVENLKELTENKFLNIVFSVKDTGIGMSSSSLERLFTPFEQIRSNKEMRYSGTGLGLALSKQLVEMMHGHINVTSSLGEGSVFNVVIPLEVTDEVPSQLSPKPSKNENNENIAVLLVEDNEFNAEILVDELIGARFKTSHAKTGMEAIDILKTCDFHIILMDIEMPGMDGFETLKKIKELKLTEAPVVAFSAHNLLSEKEKAINAGMVGYLHKPITIDTLSKAIHKHKTAKAITSNSINKKEGLALFDNDEEKYKRALLRFKKHFSETPKKLEELFEKKDFSLLKDQAHNLKSASKTIGAMHLFELAKENEALLRSKPKNFTSKDLAMFAEEIGKVIEEIGGE